MNNAVVDPASLSAYITQHWGVEKLDAAGAPRFGSSRATHQ